MKQNAKKTGFLILFTLLALFSFSACQTTPETSSVESESTAASGEKDYQAVVDQILTDIHQVATGAQQPMVKEAYYYVKEKMNKEEFAFTIDRRRKPTIYGTASFNIYNQPRGTILGAIEINVHLLDLYEKYPATVAGIVFHEFQHVRDHFSYSYMSSNYNESPLERFLYEMDASFLQSLYLLEASEAFEVDSGYMEYLMTSVRQDDLQRLAVEFYGHNKEMVYPLYSMLRQVEEGEMPLDNYLEIMANLGKNLERGEYPQGQMMVYFASVLSYAQFAAPMINPVLSEDFDLNRPDIQSINGSIQKCNTLLATEAGPFTEEMSRIRREFDIPE